MKLALIAALAWLALSAPAGAIVCVRHPRGVEAIPGVGPTITQHQCAVIRR